MNISMEKATAKRTISQMMKIDMYDISYTFIDTISNVAYKCQCYILSAVINTFSKYYDSAMIKTNFLFVFISSYDQAVEIIGVFIFTSRKYWIPNNGGLDTYTKKLAYPICLLKYSFYIVKSCCNMLLFTSFCGRAIFCFWPTQLWFNVLDKEIN